MFQSKRKPRNVQVINRCKRLECQVSKVRSLFYFLDRDICSEKIPDGELSVAFIESEEIQRLHSAYFNDTNITDVITFEGDHARYAACVIVTRGPYGSPSRNAASTQVTPHITPSAERATWLRRAHCARRALARRARKVRHTRKRRAGTSQVARAQRGEHARYASHYARRPMRNVVEARPRRAQGLSP